MLISGLFILLLVSAVSHERINGIVVNRAAALVLIYSFILSITTLNVSIIGSGIGVYGGLYQVTVVSKVIECFLYLLGAIILSNTMSGSTETVQERSKVTVQGQPCYPIIAITNKMDPAEYSVIALFTVVGGVLLISSNDLVSMYLSIELQSFGLYVLATIYRDSQSATSAGLKYFLLGGLSSGFILLGSTILYAYTGTTNLEGIYLLISTGELSSMRPEDLMVGLGSDVSRFKYIEIGLLVMTVGFLFKIASAPFHNWAPDVYDGVPTKVTTWLAIMAKITILTFLLDLAVGSLSSQSLIGAEIISQPPMIEQMLFNPLEQSSSNIPQRFISSLSNLFLICSLLSLLIGTIVGLAQSRIKRLLAYSTISHVGFLLLAIAINREDSIESFIFYLMQYSLTSANAFFILIAFATVIGGLKSPFDRTTEQEYSPIQFISQLKGQFSGTEYTAASSLLALSMAVTLFSMAGIPPLVGFFAKQAVLLAAVKNGFIFLALVGIITSVISAAYYLKVIKVMYFEKQPSQGTMTAYAFDSSIPENSGNSSMLSNGESLVLGETNEKVTSLIGGSQIPSRSVSNSLSFSISVLTLLTLLFVTKPTLILNSAHIMALSLFYV